MSDIAIQDLIASPDRTAIGALGRKLLAEGVGTFALVFAGCGAIMSDAVSGGAVSHAGIALTFGLAVMAMILATGHISGAHFNPAVTVAFALIGRFPWRQVPAYAAAQCLAAILAALALSALIGPQANLGATLPAVGPWQALALEAIMSLILMFVIVAVATDSRAEGSMAGLAIGGAVALDALFGGPLTGASMNPARSLGPALVSGDLSSMWIYVVGPLVGAAVGAALYHTLRCGGVTRDASGCC